MPEMTSLRARCNEKAVQACVLRRRLFYILRVTPFPTTMAMAYRLWPLHPNLVVSMSPYSSIMHMGTCSKSLMKCVYVMQVVQSIVPDVYIERSP